MKIYACINYCVLYRKENEIKDACPKCEVSRWKEKSRQQCDSESSLDNDSPRQVRRVPQLVLRHFPLISRLQRMFSCSKLARHMQWHKKKRLFF